MGALTPAHWAVIILFFLIVVAVIVGFVVLLVRLATRKPPAQRAVQESPKNPGRQGR